MYSDTIADMLTRIRNGYGAKKKTVVIPFSKIKEAIAGVLVANHYLEGVQVVEENKKKDLIVTLTYPQGKPAITYIARVSTSGRHIFAKHNKLPFVLSGLGKAIISTPSGIMSADEARKKSLGGEIICKVW